MSCLSRIGCLAVVALGGVGAWWYLGGDLPSGLGKRSTSSETSPSGAAPPLAWSTIDAEQGGAASDAVAALGRRNGPAYVSLTTQELARLLGASLQRALPRSAGGAQVAIAGNLVYLRADVALRDLGGDAFLGPLGRALTDRDTLLAGGTLEIVRPGLAQFRIRELRVHDVGVPARLIPMVVSALRSGTVRTDSLAGDGLPVPLPRTVADVRVSRNRVTFYKATP